MNNITDLGNELVAVSVPIESYQPELNIDHENEWFALEYYKDIDDEESGFYGECSQYDVHLPKADYELLGTITASEISFDVEPYVDPNHGMLNNQYYFRWILASKRLYFENPYGELRRPQYFPDGADYNSPIELYNAQQKWDKAQQNLVQKLVILKRTS